MSKGRKVERKIEIDASPDVVWKALTDAEELKRWFPLDARVRPGEGGSLWLSWGEGSEWETPIEIWQPPRHLRTVDTTPGKEGAGPLRVAVDYLIEAGEGTTTVRIVHSGFADDAWDDEIDSIDSGWAAFLAGMKHYLERHGGQQRRLVSFRHPPVALPRPEVFGRTMAALGLDPASLRPGSRYETTTRGGDRFEGVTALLAPPINFTATVENWNDGFLMVEIEPGRGRCRPAVWLSLYGEARGSGDAVEERLRTLLRAEFAGNSAPEG
ncbi:MAG TPA: SRPBCC domain-containing protein [Thermoanaerobaculia bacterium]|nr:SRPBCC domain-containing protein [Thermoanaerobaculia bacterium]